MKGRRSFTLAGYGVGDEINRPDCECEPMRRQDRLGEIHRLLNSAVLLADHEDVPSEVEDCIWNAFESVQPHL